MEDLDINKYFDSLELFPIIAAKAAERMAEKGLTFADLSGDDETLEGVDFIEDLIIDHDWTHDLSDTTELETEEELDQFHNEALEAARLKVVSLVGQILACQ
jgi:hypothetical protein